MFFYNNLLKIHLIYKYNLGSYISDECETPLMLFGLLCLLFPMNVSPSFPPPHHEELSGTAEVHTLICTNLDVGSHANITVMHTTHHMQI